MPPPTRLVCLVTGASRGIGLATTLELARRGHLGSGVVVQVSSLNGRLVPPLGGLYAASKFALEALSEALAYEVARFGVRVAIVEPGPYETGVWDALDVDRSLTAGTSPYGPLFERTFPTFRSRAMPNVSEVAVAIANAAADPATPLRVPVGMGVERFRERRRELDDEQFAREWWEHARSAW